ncbi:unnamed protein product [Echinostoma caproni]|uniref:Usp domain-containing protein n=1 Tax=Echinostoma caproni TaxID=27848 RepID=A0A183AXR2_9TREM|nr:unnamed protein product [Echinostoma caproni]
MPTDYQTDQEHKIRRRVILPTDSSQHSKRAREWYYEKIMEPGDLLLFIHIIEPIHPKTIVSLAIESCPALAGTTLRVSDESIKEGEQLCRNCMQEATEHGVKNQSFLYIDTKPGVALVKVIHELKGDYVIMGNRGVGKVRRTFFGSVSSYVLHHVNVPVSIVPPLSR